MAIDISQGLGMLSQGLGQMQQRNAEEEQKLSREAMMKQAGELYKGGNIDDIMAFSIQNPQMGENIMKSLNFKNDQTKQNMMDSVFSIIQNPENTEQTLTDRIKMVQDNGGDPTQSIAELANFKKNPEGYTEGVERFAAFNDPKRLTAAREALNFGQPKEITAYEQAQLDQGQQRIGIAQQQANTAATADKTALAKAQAKAATGESLKLSDVKGLNNDVTSMIKPTMGIINSAKSLEGLQKSSSSAAKLAAVFKFMKALDPDSAVMEGEQRMAASTGGVFDSMTNQLNKAFGDGNISDKVFSDFVATANNLANSAQEGSVQEITDYLDVYGDSLPKPMRENLLKRVPPAIRQQIKNQEEKSIFATPDVMRSAPAPTTAETAHRANTGQQQKPIQVNDVMAIYGFGG